MQCEEAILDIAPLLSGDLEQEAERALLAHLEHCSACATEADRLHEMWMQLGEIPVEPPDAARMRTRFATAVERFQTGLDQARAETLDRRPHTAAGSIPSSSTPTPSSAWLIAVAASLVVGVLVGRETVRATLTPAAAPAADLALLRQELHDTREMATLALLRQSSASERLRGVSWTERIDNPGADVVLALLDTLAHDPNVNVRLAAVEALTRYTDRPGVRSGAVAALAGPSSPLVQVALIDLLVRLDDPSLKNSLQHLVDDGDTDEAVRSRAQQALLQMG